MVETQQKYVTYPTLSEDFQFVMHFLFTQNLRCVGGRGYLVNGANDTIIELAKNNNNNINNKNNKNNNKKNNFYEVINNIIIINDEEEEEEDEVGNLFNFIDTFFYPNFLAHWREFIIFIILIFIIFFNYLCYFFYHELYCYSHF